jgi:hypothetical protein
MPSNYLNFFRNFIEMLLIISFKNEMLPCKLKNFTKPNFTKTASTLNMLKPQTIIFKANSLF